MQRSSLIRRSKSLGMSRYLVTGVSGTVYLVEWFGSQDGWRTTITAGPNAQRFFDVPTKRKAMAQIESHEDSLGWQ